MFIPKRCPRCKNIAGWRETYNPHFHNAVENMIRFLKGYGKNEYVYRCEKCGYEGAYDDQAETLSRHFKRRL